MVLISVPYHVWCSALCIKFEIEFFFFKQKTAYEVRISDWSSDVCSSDLPGQIRQDTGDLFPRVSLSDPSRRHAALAGAGRWTRTVRRGRQRCVVVDGQEWWPAPADSAYMGARSTGRSVAGMSDDVIALASDHAGLALKAVSSDEHPSEPQS